MTPVRADLLETDTTNHSVSASPPPKAKNTNLGAGVPEEDALPEADAAVVVEPRGGGGGKLGATPNGRMGPSSSSFFA